MIKCQLGDEESSELSSRPTHSRNCAKVVNHRRKREICGAPRFARFTFQGAVDAKERRDVLDIFLQKRETKKRDGVVIEKFIVSRSSQWVNRNFETFIVTKYQSLEGRAVTNRLLLFIACTATRSRHFWIIRRLHSINFIFSISTF